MLRYLYKIYDFYAEGFRNMKLGKLLWCRVEAFLLS